MDDQVPPPDATGSLGFVFMPLQMYRIAIDVVSKFLRKETCVAVHVSRQWLGGYLG